MAKLPELPYYDQISRSVQKTFGGYQHLEGSYDGTIYDMTNMSSDHYPLLATRAPRVTFKTATAFRGCVTVGDVFCYVNGDTLYKDDVPVGSLADSEKSFGVLGDRVLIFPDKKYLNLTAKGRYPNLEQLSADVAAPADGDVYAVGGMSPYALFYWAGSAWKFLEYEFGAMNPILSCPAVFKAEGALYGEKAARNGIYAEGIDWNNYFRKGDAVTISGCTLHPENNKTPVIREIDGSTLYFYENIFTVTTVWRYTATALLAAGNYYFSINDSAYRFTLATALAAGDTLTWDGTILSLSTGTVPVTTGKAGTALTLKETPLDYTESSVTITREVPDLDFLCTAYNRLWGCKGDLVYASKLGDPFNFNVFDSLATDSYSVETGSPGSFTACCCYLGYPTFFKEEVIYKIYGSAPSNFEAVAAFSAGVAKGSHRSLAVAGEMLFYLSRAGVVSYSGGAPVFLRAPFGNIAYGRGVAGSDGAKYYISMADNAGIFHLFVYDTTLSLWHKEDDQEMAAFYYRDHCLMMVDSEGAFMTAANGNTAFTGTLEAKLSWLAEFGDFIENSPDKKAVTKVLVRLDLDDGAEAELGIGYDGKDYLKIGKTLTGARKRSWYLPLIPARCDYFRLRIKGRGGCRIHSLTVEYSAGSAL